MGINLSSAPAAENVLIYRQRFFQNDANRLLGKTVSLLQMTLNSRFHEPALAVFEIGYNRRRREYDHAAGTFQI